MMIRNRFDIKLYLFIILVCTIISCEKDVLVKDDELSLKKVDFTGDQLRIDGYYYQKYGIPEKLTIYFFYNKGTLLFAGDGYELSKSKDFEQSFLTNQFIEKLREIKFCWGLFNIETANIKFERWYPSSGLHKAYLRTGKIINDTTFVITESFRMQNGGKTEVEKRSETYHFKQFSPKPDSTNSFIK